MATPELIAPGSLIGEMAMLVEHDYGSTVVARDRVLCLKLMRAELYAQMQEDAGAGRDRDPGRPLSPRATLRRVFGSPHRDPADAPDRFIS